MRRLSAFYLSLLTTTLLAQPTAPAPVPAASTGWVVIPLKDYDTLRDKIAPPDTGPEPAFDATLTRVDYELSVKDTRATGRITLAVDVLRDGWVQVPIPTGLLIADAKLPPSARLIDGAAVAFSKKGRYVIQLDAAVPITLNNGEQQITLPAGNSGVTRASLTLGRSGMDVTVKGGVLPDSTGDPWIAYANNLSPFALTWRQKVEEHPEELPLKQTAKFVQLWSLGEDSSALTAEVSLDINQGTSRQLILTLPAGLTINQVLGADVADWSAQGNNLTVTFLEPVENETSFVIQAESKLAREGALDLPLLRLQGVERETGGVAVELLGPAEIKSAAPQGLQAAEPSELGGIAASRQSPSLSAFRFVPRATARALKVQVARYTQQAMLTANVEEARIHALLSAEGKALVRARYAVRNNQRNFLKITLPTGATLWSAATAGRPVRPGQGPNGSLMFPLSKSTGGDDAPAFAVEVTYLLPSTAWTDRGRATLNLPSLDLPVSRSGVVLFVPPRYKVTPEPGAFRTAVFVEAESPAFNQPAQPPVSPRSNLQTNTSSLQNSQLLIDSFRASRELRQPVRIPGSLDFPAFGPSLFLAAELTGENQQPRVEISFQKERGGSK